MATNMAKHRSFWNSDDVEEFFGDRRAAYDDRDDDALKLFLEII